MGNVAATRTRLKALLETVTGFSASTVKLGMYYPDDSATDECFGFVTVAAPLIVICPGELDEVTSFKQDALHAMTEWHLKLLLYHAYTNFTAFDYTALEDQIEAILLVITNPANWATARVSRPHAIEPFKKKAEHKATPRVILSEMKISFKGTIQ